MSDALDEVGLARRRVFLGGTFDPVHIGHARLLLESQRALNADAAVFVPSASPPLKQHPIQTYEHRFAMAALAANELNDVAGESALFSVSDCEKHLSGPSFTLNTLKRLREVYPNDVVYWVVGMDNLVNLNSWHRWQELSDWANLVVFNRPGYERPLQGVVHDWLQSCLQPTDAQKLSGRVIFLESIPLSVSSTEIRRQLENDQNPKFLLPDSVYSYIREHGLYC